MFKKNTFKLMFLALSTTVALGPAHAYQYAPNSYYDNSRYGNNYGGSGMGMGMGSGSRSNQGYYGRPGYGYQRPQRPPMQPYYYQQPMNAPYGYQKPQVQTPTTANTSTTDSDSDNNKVIVNIQGMAFQPTNLTVKTGEAVTWINNDSAPHTVTSADGGPLASGTLNPGARYQITFDKAGTYTYYCKFHPSMRATITVE